VAVKHQVQEPPVSHPQVALASAIFRPGLLSGRTALITGGGSGLGRAIALEYAACGASVVVCGRRAEPLDETVALAGSGSCEARPCDVRDEGEIDELVSWVTSRHGAIDVLVNNAGGQYLSPAEEITPKGFRTVISLNVESAWLTSHAVATRSMIPNGGGRIINVTLSPHHGLPGMAHSTAARAAVESLTRVLSIEWARFGIKLNAIAAGHFGTDTFFTKYPQSVVEEAAGTIPAQRLGRPEELAWLAAFLASDAGDYFSGAVVTLDGARDNWRGAWPPPSHVEETGRLVAERRNSESDHRSDP
jgi:citronellol/citronellal dehydrogenase